MSHQTLTYLKQRFEQVGLKLNSPHGQNFLIDLNLVRDCRTAQLSPDDVVLEVGTGVGSLTGLMAPQVAHVVTVEIDPRMRNGQRRFDRFCERHGFAHRCALAGKHMLNPVVLAEIDRQLSAASERRFKLVANLPYVIATPLIANLLELDRPPETMTVTIQKELGERLAAQPGTKDYGALSFWVQASVTWKSCGIASHGFLAAAKSTLGHCANYLGAGTMRDASRPAVLPRFCPQAISAPPQVSARRAGGNV